MDAAKSREPKYIAILALASVLILIVGWLARPREISQNPPIPSETELEQLSRRADRRSLDSISKYVAGTARDVESSIVYLRSAQMSGIAWEGRRLLTAPFQSRRITESTTVAGQAAKPTIWGPHLPFTALEISPGPALVPHPARRATSFPSAGSWLVAVWRTEAGYAFAPGTFQHAAAVNCGVTPVQQVLSSLSFTPVMAGGGLFDVDGNLLSVILPCGERLIPVAVASIQSLIEKSNTMESRMLSRYGLVIGSLAADESNYFKIKEGVLVREVWTGYPGDESGLMPGDIVTGLGGNAVTRPGDLMALTTSTNQEFVLEVQRGNKKLRIALHDDGTSVSPDTKLHPDAGIVWESSPRDYRIDTVQPGSRAAKAGIESGDRLVRIDHSEPRNLAQVQQILAGNKSLPVFLELERGSRRVGILVP